MKFLPFNDYMTLEKDDSLNPLEDFMYGYLDGGNEPTEADESEFLTKIRPSVERTTGLETPEEINFLRYDDTEQMTYDQLRLNQKRSPDVESMSNREKASILALTPFMPLLAMKKRWELKKKSEKIGGCYIPPLEVEGLKDPFEKNTASILLSNDNIEEHSRIYDLENTGISEFYIKTHEVIHSAQYESHPELFDGAASYSDRAVREGHAVFFTDRVMKEELDIGIEEIHERQNRSLRDTLGEFKYKLPGFNRPYADGFNFINEVYKEGGSEMVEKALEEPPDKRELKAPLDWLETYE